MVLVEVLLLIGVVVFILAAGFFSGSETAIISADRAQLHAAALEGDRRAPLAETLLARIESVIGTTLVGTNFAVSTTTTLATVLIARHVPPQWQTAAATLIMTPLILVFGEIVPKSICRAYAFDVTLRIARPLSWAQRAMYPVVWFVSKSADLLLRVMGVPKADAQHTLSREELVIMAELGQEQGALAPQESRMIQRLLELSERPVSTAMVPLVDVVTVAEQANVQAVKDLAARTGFTRFPVYQGRVDNIVGIVTLVDILYADAKPQPPSPDESIARFVHRDVTFAPQTKPIGTLLRELQHSLAPMVIVVNERGAVVGIVTTEDIVEQIVGEIDDERDRTTSSLPAPGAGTFECDAKLDIDELNERLKLGIEKRGFDTVGGLVMKLAGRVPQAGESLLCKGFRIEVIEAEPRRVKRLRFVRTPPE